MTSRPIFILSHFRSGSTLLRYILDAHPSVCCPAELRLAAFCQMAFKVVELTLADRSPESEIGATASVRVRELVDQVMTAYCERKGKSRWCDKSPANTELLYVLTTIFHDAQYVCLYRHPLDQIWSFLDIEGPMRVQLSSARYGGDAVAGAVDMWCSYTERLLAFEHLHRHETLRIVYESLVAQPEVEIGRLLQFLKLHEVPGLVETSFQTRHDRGPGDVRIRRTAAITPDRVGKGRDLKIDYLPHQLQQRLAGLVAALAMPSRP